MKQPWILDYDSANCAIGAAVGITGERPTFLVLRETFNGVRQECAGGLQAELEQPARRGDADRSGSNRPASCLCWLRS